jgi:hypothetical protein
MGLEFVTKAPSASSVKKQGLFTSLLKVNTNNNNFNFSKKVILDLVGADEDGKANEFRAGFAYDGEKQEIYLFLHPEGKKASKSGTFSDTHHAEKFIATLGLEAEIGNVLEFEVKTEDAVENEEHGVTLYPVIFKEATAPRATKSTAKDETVENTEETPVETPVMEVTAVEELPEAPTEPQETTEAELQGDNPTDIAELGSLPTGSDAPAAPQLGEWPS